MLTLKIDPASFTSRARLFRGDLVFGGCLLWPFLLSFPSRALYDVNFGMEFVFRWELTLFPRLVLSERTIWRLCFVLGEEGMALPGPSTMFLLLPFDSLIVNLLGISLTVLFTLLLVFIIVPAIFGVSFGIRKLYMKTLLKIFAVSCALYKWLLHRGGKELFFSGWLLSLLDLRKLGEWEVAFWVKRITTCVLGKVFSLVVFLLREGTCMFDSSQQRNLTNSSCSVFISKK